MKNLSFTTLHHPSSVIRHVLIISNEYVSNFHLIHLAPTTSSVCFKLQTRGTWILNVVYHAALLKMIDMATFIAMINLTGESYPAR